MSGRKVQLLIRLHMGSINFPYLSDSELIADNSLLIEEEAYYHASRPEMGTGWQDSANNIELHWMPDYRFAIGDGSSSAGNPDFAAEEYRVYRRQQGNTGWIQVGSTIGGQTTFIDTSVPNFSQTYEYNIVTFYDSEEHRYSDPDDPIIVSPDTQTAPQFLIVDFDYFDEMVATGNSYWGITVMRDDSSNLDGLTLEITYISPNVGPVSEIISGTTVGNSKSFGFDYGTQASLQESGGAVFRLLYNGVDLSFTTNTDVSHHQRYLRNTVNNRVMSRGWKSYLLDLSKPITLDRLVDIANEQISRGYDGIFLDNVSSNLPATVQFVLPYTYNSSSYENEMALFVEALIAETVSGSYWSLNCFSRSLIRRFYENSINIAGYYVDNFGLFGNYAGKFARALWLDHRFSEYEVVHGYKDANFSSGNWAGERSLWISSYLVTKSLESPGEPETLYGIRDLPNSDRRITLAPEQLIDLGALVDDPLAGFDWDQWGDTGDFQMDDPAFIDAGYVHEVSTPDGPSYFAYRKYEKGIVLSNVIDPYSSSITSASLMDILGSDLLQRQTYYRVDMENGPVSVTDGAKLSTTPVASDEIIPWDHTDRMAYVFMYDPISSPEVAEIAFHTLVNASFLSVDAVLAVNATHWNNEPLEIRVDGTVMGWPSNIQLLDNGDFSNGDAVAGDGIYSWTAGNHSGVNGNNILRLRAVGSDGLMVYQDLVVWVSTDVPAVASEAIYPLPVGANQTPLVTAIPISPIGAQINDVFVDVSSLGGLSHLSLNDLGEDGDLVAGDGTWSARTSNLTGSLGLNTLPVSAIDEFSNSFFGVLQVELIAGLLVRYEDRTEETELEYTGQPFSAVTLDFDGDQFKDMFISIDGGEARLFLSHGVNNEVPVFEGAYPVVFPDGPLPYSLLGLSVADYNNDGDQDIFCASQDQPRLYAAHAGAFRDSTALLGLDVAGLESVAASWGDYDKDGRVDLAIGRSRLYENEPGSLEAEELPDYLLHNDSGTGGGFTNVSNGAGISPTDMTNCVSVTWCDVDSNGYPDLFFGDTRENPRDSDVGYPLNMYLNQGDGTFTESWSFPLVGSHVSGIECGDLNNDGLFDVVLSSQFLSSRVFMNTGGDNFDLNSCVVFDYSDSYETSGLRVFDYDLDGLQDALFFPHSENSSPVLIGNFSTSSQFEFKELSPLVGLDSPGIVGGAIAADFNFDGDVDLFLGREGPSADGIYFQAMNAIPGIDAPTNNWLSVDLFSPDGVNNTMGIGTVVTLFAGDLIQAQQVDGGSGRGGQADHTLVFGMGAHTTVDSLVIIWPNGFRQVENPGPGVNEFEDDSTLSITQGTTQASYEIDACDINLIFAWETNIATPPWKDKVTIIHGDPPNCTVADISLSPASADVEHTISRISDGTYRHELKWNNQPCSVGCFVRYKVESAAGSTLVVESPERGMTITVCGKNHQLSQ